MLLYLTKSYLKSMETNCECQYTVTLMDEVIHRQFSETRDNFNHVPSIHEVDEEETDDEEYIYDQESTTPKDINQSTDATQDIVDDSLYGNESFCSDESYNESEDTNIMSRSFDDSHLPFQIINHKCNKEDIANDTETDTTQDNEVINSSRCKSSTSEDKFVALKQIKTKKKNMSFTDEELRKIEWENQMLLKKIMSHQKPKDKILRNNLPQPRISSSAINRKKLQKKIENENIVCIVCSIQVVTKSMMQYACSSCHKLLLKCYLYLQLLLQRIQQTKSCVTSTMVKSGCRQTIFENP